FAKDITRRKAKDAALRQANLIVENSPAVLFRRRADQGWPVEMVSGNVAQFGYIPEEFLSGAIPYYSMIFPGDQERVTSELRQYSSEGTDKFQQEYRIVTKDGDVRWIDDRTTVERDADGRISHYQGIVIDITDRKRTESVIAARMRLLQFAEAHTVDELLEATLNELEELTGSCIGFYHFLEDDQQTLRLQNWSTRTRKELCSAAGKGLHYDVSAAGVWVDCIRQRRPVIHNDYASLPNRKGLPPGHPPVTRELVVPVFRGESIMAVLGVGNKPRNYTSEDMETVSLLADLSWGIVERKRAEEALRVSEQNYRDIVEHAPFGICHTIREGKMLKANPALARILKYDSVGELLETVNQSSIQDVLFTEPFQRNPLLDFICAGDGWHIFENRYRCKDGSIITCNVHTRRIFDMEAGGVEYESFLENVNDRVKAENALRESEEKFRVLAETAPAAIVVYQGEYFVYVNQSAVRLFGYSEPELLNMRFWEWVHPEQRELVKNRGLARQRGESFPAQYEQKFVDNAGKEGWVMVSTGTIVYQGKPAGIATLVDITETKRAEERVQAALAEKEVLLKEVHHRVKNNLQIISSLLDLQSDYIHEGESRRYITESQDRIRSMALVHEQLYKSDDLSLIDFARYVNDLVTHLGNSLLGNRGSVATEVDVRNVELGIDEAIPCGLIINELVSNALEHAFSDGGTGIIRICGTMDEEGNVRLSVSDNGKGFPPGFDFSASESLGLQIVSLLAHQLFGTIEIQGDAGVSATLLFKSKAR
ncbi:MAG TPA: PAS domain S-box protein, partial [Geobacteraceae bacterium]|nr:PAS domain S-box protein [Geobacteraceae bacterium]